MARSKKRIKPFMKYLEKKWLESPDLRFGQFLINEGIVSDDIRTWSLEISDYPIPHEVMREIQTWDKRLECWKVKDIFIKDLDTDHIVAILKTQFHIKDTKIEIILKNEMKFRKKNKKEEIKKSKKKKIN